MRNKLTELILSFCCVLTITVILSDLGLSHFRLWNKYEYAVGVGIIWTFLRPKFENSKEEIKNR